MSKMFCGNGECGAYLGSRGADSCVHCGWIDPDAVEATATEQLLQRIAELERQLHEQAVSLEEARTVLQETGLLLHHFWRDVQMNEYSFEKLNKGIEAIDAAMQKGQS